MQQQLTSYFWSGDSLRSRSVGRSIPTGTLEVPALPARLLVQSMRLAKGRVQRRFDAAAAKLADMVVNNSRQAAR